MKVTKMTLAVATLILCASGYTLADSFPSHDKGHHDMAEADTNKDGKISHDEFIAASTKRAEEMFKRMDTNNDGFIDQAEKEAMHEKMREHMKDWRNKSKNGTASDLPPPN